MTAALVVALTLASVDPCAEVTPLADRDPEAAAVYRQVGEAERRAGSLETAAVAYRAALARDASDAASRAGLQAVCGSGSGLAFQQGLARMDAGDLPGAIALFRRARASGPDLSSELVEGICHYELGEDEQARSLLEEAQEAPAHHEAASFYLGLLALRRGEGGQAAALLDAAAASPGFAPAAADLARLARRTGRLVLSIAGESGWDSNAQLAPTGTPLGTSSDGSYGLTANALFRPLGESGPYLRAFGSYRQQLRFGDLDYGGASGAAGWQVGGGARGALAEYDYDYRLLGGASFLSAHRLLAAGWLTAGGVTLGASYFARFETYLPSLYQPFSGTLQRVEATAAVPLSGRARLLLGYRVAQDATERSSLSWLEHGPRAELRFQLSARARLGADAALSFRDFDAVDPLLGLRRSDTYLDAVGFAEWDLADHWTVRLGLEARDASSNATDFAYLRVAPMLGLAYVMGM